MGLTLHCQECGNEVRQDVVDPDKPVACPKCGSQIDIPVVGIGPGTLIRGFRVEKKLGQGAMGVVYLATQLAMSRKVALKILPPEITGDAHLIHRFLREVQMLARIDHPNIVTAFDAGDEKGIYYLAMTYVDGQDLEKRLIDVAKLPEKEALKIIREVAEALAYAWEEHRILHNDIKPGNIIIDSRGNVKLMDLGLSKSVFDDTNMSLSGTGRTFGTPNYMSPEQAQGVKNLDTRSDQYALGATLYRLVTGVLPHSGTSVVELLTKKLFEPIPPARTHNPDISDACEHFLEVLMARDRNQRYDRWQDLIADLDRVVLGQHPLAARPGAGESAIDIAATPAALKAPPGPKFMKIQPKDAPHPIQEVPPEPAAKKGLLVAAALVAVAIAGAIYFLHSAPAPVVEKPATAKPVPPDLSWGDDFGDTVVDVRKWERLTAPLEADGDVVLTGPAMEWGAEGILGSRHTPIPIDAKGAVEARITILNIELLATDPEFKNAGYFDLVLSSDPTRTSFDAGASLAVLRLQCMANHIYMFQVGVKLANARSSTDPIWLGKMAPIPDVMQQSSLRMALVVSADKVRVTFEQKGKVLLQQLYSATFPESFVKHGVAPELYVANQGKGRLRVTIDDFQIRPVEKSYLLESKP